MAKVLGLLSFLDCYLSFHALLHEGYRKLIVERQNAKAFGKRCAQRETPG